MTGTGAAVPSDAILDLKENAKGLDQMVNSVGSTFFGRDLPEFPDGRELLTIKGMNEAATTGNPSVGAAQDALDYKNEAQTYAEAAATNADWVYANVAAGEAERIDGDYFWVVSADNNEVLELWLMGATTATDTGKRTASKLYIENYNYNAGNPVYAVTDSDGRAVLMVDKDGKLTATPTEDTKESFSYLKKDSSGNIMLALEDSQGKIPFLIDSEGKTKDTSGTTVSITEGILSDQPLFRDSKSVSISSLTLYQSQLPISLTAEGQTGDPAIQVNGDGLAHPKVEYIPGGWNGYKYWMAVTPIFGVIGNQSKYENPHVLASNDLLNWFEPAGGRIDKPEDGNGSYWSDTHIALGDDGYMYCWYRGSGFSFSGRFYAAKRSRDGANWSERYIVTDSSDASYNINSGNLIVSPCFFKNGARWACYDLLRDSLNGLQIPPTGSCTETHVFRRNDVQPNGDYEPYTLDQRVNYKNREWGASADPWHIDAIKIGNLYLHLVATGPIGGSSSSDLYLAWSSDGWNFTVLPKVATGQANMYRSCINLESYNKNVIDLTLFANYTDGTIDLFKLKLEVF